MLVMQVTNGKGYLGCVELGSIFRKASGVTEVHEELTTSNEAHDEEDFLFGLENIIHAN